MVKFLRVLVLGLVLQVQVFSLPAISGSPVAAASGWTEFGEVGASTVDSVSTPGTVSIASGLNSNGIAISAFGTSVGMGPDFGQNDGIPLAVSGNGFFNENGNAHVAGFYQSFTTTAAATISFDYSATQQANPSGDPFAYVYHSSNTLVAFVRGKNSNVNGLDSNGSGTFVFGGATSLGNGLYSNGDYFTGGLLDPGTYFIGFGYGVNPSASPAGVNTLSVSNLRATAMVPEIDASTAGLPVAIALMVLCLVLDRRRSAVSV